MRNHVNYRKTMKQLTMANLAADTAEKTTATARNVIVTGAVAVTTSGVIVGGIAYGATKAVRGIVGAVKAKKAAKAANDAAPAPAPAPASK